LYEIIYMSNESPIRLGGLVKNHKQT